VNRVKRLWNKITGKTPQKKVIERAFAGAAHNRLTADWMTSSLSTNQEIESSQPTMLNRGRDLGRNDRNMKRFLGLCERNIVGEGFVLRSLVNDPNGTPDTEARNAIEKGFKEWGKKGVATVCGRYSFRQAHRKSVRDKARDGEYLVRMIEGKQAGNKFNFALQLIPVETLDYQYSARLNNGNFIVMGVEYNKWNRPLAFHMFTETPYEVNSNWNGERIRIPASEIVHSFVQMFENQARGISWAHAVFRDMKNYDQFLEAEEVGARITACTSTYYETPDEWTDEDIKKFNPPATMEPGTSEIGVAGVKKQILDPTANMSNLAQYQKSVKRDISQGLDIQYNTFAMDLEGVNFSSIRAGTLDERDSWKVLQGDEVDDLLDVIFPIWLQWALLSGAITTTNGRPLPATKYEKFLPHNWQGRRWQWVDPLKDLQTNEGMVRNGWRTNSQVTSEHANDYFDNLDELAVEKQASEGALNQEGNTGEE